VFHVTGPLSIHYSVNFWTISWKEDEETGVSEYPLVTAAIELVDNACAVFFVAEYLLRLICRFSSLLLRDHL
jgi:hypothetical protein